MRPDQHHRRGMARRVAAAAAVLAGLALAGPAGAAVLPATTCTLAGTVRTCELYAQTGTVDIPTTAKATLSLGNAVTNDTVVYAAAATGPGGNDVTVSYTAASPSESLVVQVVGKAIEVQLATDAGGAPISTAAEIVAAVNADAAASALVTAALPGSATGAGVPTPVGPTPLGGGSATLPTWTFGETAGGHPTRVGGPTLVAVAGETLRLIVHNEIPGENVAPTVPQQPAPPLSTKAAPGGTVILTIPALRAGTSIYEAGAIALPPGIAAADLPANAKADDVEQQVAMGLYGALVVRPSAGATTAYSGSDSRFDDESVLVLSEIDPALNSSANPAAFPMTSFAPAFRLIGGHAYAGDGSLSTAPIVAAPGDRVLLRYVNAGVADHSMGLLGLHQTVVGEAGVASRAREAIAETIPPGETLDTVVTLPVGSDGTNYVISDQGQRLDNAGAGWSTTGARPLDTGGMLTYISATSSGAPVTCYGPATGNVHAPDVTSGHSALGVTAHFTPCGGSAVTDAELMLDTTETGAAYPASVVPDGAGWKLDPAAEIPQTALATLASGDHVVFVRARDADGKWGSVAADTFTVDTTGPAITGVTVKPAVTMGAAGSKIALTLTADDSATGNQNVSTTPGSATATLDGTTTVNLVTQVAGHAPAPILALTATITLTAALAEGTHVIALQATDALGNVTAPAVNATFVDDRSGPATSGVTIAPSPNNGTLDDPGQPGNVVAHAHVSDPNAVSHVARAEGFIDTVGANGSGFTFVPADGALDTSSEDMLVWIPLGTIASLAEGTHTLYVHGLDAAGNWGATSTVTFVIDYTGPTVHLTAQTPIVGGAPVTLTGAVTDPVAAGVSSPIQRIEWFVGADPGVGLGRTDGVTIGAGTGTIVVPVSALRPGGSNTVNVRAMDAAGNWSVLQPVIFTVPFRFAYPFDGPLAVSAANPFSATAWSSSTRPARLGIDSALKAAGASSLRVALGAVAGSPLRTAWLTKRVQTPLDVATVSFAFDPNRALFGAGGTTILEGFGGTQGVFRLQVRQQGSPANPTYQVQAQYRSSLFGIWAPLNPSWHAVPATGFTTITLGWSDRAAGGTTALRLTVGASTFNETVSPIGRATLAMDSVQLGAIDGVPNSATGFLHFDSFVLTSP